MSPLGIIWKFLSNGWKVVMIDKVIGSVIAMQNIDIFSVVEIRTAYIALQNNEELNPATVRQFVYKELLKLVKKGWLTKNTTKTKGLARYSKTELFDSNRLKTLEHLPDYSITNKIQPIDYKENLRNRLNNYNSELLEGLGALKEYVALKDLYPELYDSLKHRYVAVQENNHILTGKISVLKELIKSNECSDI